MGLKSQMDNECKFLQHNCTHSCAWSKDVDNNIVKVFPCKDVYAWETFVYLNMVDEDIFPLVSPQTDTLTYITKDLISLRTLLNGKSKFNTTLLLNELFSCIHKFKSLHFMHGNLNMDNIFVNPSSLPTDPQFVVIDYANSIITGLKQSPQYERTSFLKESCQEVDWNWDFCTLYFCLKLYFKGNIAKLRLLDDLVATYVRSDTLRDFLNRHFHNLHAFFDF
jgi:hypothetical protein